MTAPRLSPIEVKVLAALATGNDQDFGYLNFSGIVGMTRLKRDVIRRACRSLTRKGFAVFGRGLWTEDGEPAGSGYCSTTEGRAAADPRLVKRYENKRWQ